MLKSTRNSQFEEKKHLIGKVIGKNYRLVKGFGLPVDDLRQDLAVVMLEAMEEFDPAISLDMDRFIYKRMENKLKKMTAPSARYGVSEAPRQKPFKVLSLDAENQHGQKLNVPHQDDAAGLLWLQEEITALPDEQRNAINKLLSGKRVHCNNKNLQAARKRLRSRMEEMPILQYA